MKDDQRLLEQAKNSASNGDTKTAIHMLRDLLVQNPNDVEAWLVLADIVKKPEQKRQCLERVLKINPNNPIAQKKLSEELSNESDYLIETADFPADEEEDKKIAPELDFSYVYEQEDQPQQIQIEDNQPEQLTQADGQQLDETTKPVAHLVSPQENIPERRPTRPKTNNKSPIRTNKKRLLGRNETLLIGSLFILCLLLGVIGVAFFGTNVVFQPEPTNLPEDVTAVIYENIRASNAENLNGYMATIHSKSPGYDSTKETIEIAFSDAFDLNYRLSDVYIIEQGRNEAKVHFVLTTILSSGTINFRDNRVTGEMTLRKEDGNWKIFDQKVIEVDYLD